MNTSLEEQTKFISDLVIENLDSIYNTCVKTAKSFKKESLPLNFLKIVIDKAKPKFTKNIAVDNLVKEYHKTLDLLYLTCVHRAKMVYKTNNSITLTSLKFFIDKIKKEYKISLRNVRTGN